MNLEFHLGILLLCSGGKVVGGLAGSKMNFKSSNNYKLGWSLRYDFALQTLVHT